MQETKNKSVQYQIRDNSNPLIQSVVYTSLQHAIREIGLPEFPQSVFTEEMKPYLQSAGSLLPFDEATLVQLWKSMLRGTVIATEVWKDEAQAFYVRGGAKGIAVDVRLTCLHHQWHVESVIAMYSQPMWHTRWFRRTAVIAAVVVAGLLGYAFHQPSAAISPSAMQSSVGSSATANGLSGDALGNGVDGNATGLNAVSNTANQNDTSTNSATSQPPTTLTFTLKPGMSLYELSKYLQSQHLVHSTMAFEMLMKKTGVDKKLKPGVYQFRSDMTTNELIDVLRQGPSKS